MNANWYYRLLAVLLAVVSWYLVTGRERVETWVKVKIEMAGLAEGLVLRGTPRDSIDVLVRGPKGLIRRIEPGALVYTLDARRLSAGANTILVDPDAIPVAKLFEVAEVRPSSLTLEVERRLSKTVPVRVAFKDQARDYKVTAQADPSQVSVSGPESLVRPITEVAVQPVVLPEEPSGSFEAQAGLVLPEQVDASPRLVGLKVQYQVTMREAAVEVPVRVLSQGRAGVTVAPEHVLIRFLAPVPLLREGGWRGLVDASVEVAPDARTGRHESTYRVTLPQGCELVAARPEKVAVTIK